ncbi:uncharacterized protein BCR38DRAFT_404146 [Pseudomassariella vexata]|uniref:Uncharacterized protein n=1 Tax=Pseudomassariella vexata TaxID=1141098 RepID=A0A1Y2EHI1_9PEZI|nr:uncharacterized protein BCR38DRAFT_404146 [Pseudomassariella vexata]ORY71020.1 hypothetical protein BCR38DRAFT_404146 [Pseudomassariella vexata]
MSPKPNSMAPTKNVRKIKSDDDDTSTVSTLITTYTPSQDSTTGSKTNSPSYIVPGFGESVPCHNQVFVIRHRASGRAIAINDNGDVHLALFADVGTTQSCHWKCIETDGWLGFKHEGRFLGHDGRGGYRAEAKAHNNWEYFCEKRVPGLEGGSLLMQLRGWVFEKLDVEGEGDGLRLVKKMSGGAVWDFVKI